MKRLLLSLLILISSYVVAQTYNYTAYEFAYKEAVYGYWSSWSNWERCDILVQIDFTRDVVRIYSADTQVYQILDYVKKFTDSSGGQQAEFRFIDQDYDLGTMRLRIERNGTSQMYIEFANVMWVYNIRRR